MATTYSGYVTRVCVKDGSRGQYLGITVERPGQSRVWFSQPYERLTYNLESEEGFGNLPDGPVFFPGDAITVVAGQAEQGDGITFLKYTKVGGLDDLGSEASERVSSGPSRPAQVPVGTYTVVLGDGSHRTLRLEAVEEAGSNFDGWVFAKYLAGPDNTADYQNFAYCRAGEDTFTPKKGFRPDSDVMAALATLLSVGSEQRHEMGVAYALASGNCYICNRLLTEPTSIERGIGPVCAAKAGL